MPQSKLIFPSPTGFVAPGFEDILSVFYESFKNGIDKGASFAAYYKGAPVVNIWGGLADEEVKRPWKEDTMGFFHSTTKFVAAVVIAHLVERGHLDYKQKISTYWPEFAQNGKENITLDTFLCHRGGLSALSENYYLKWMTNDLRKLLDVLASQQPLWTPGSAQGYHAHTFGLYLDEIVRRVDKKFRNVSEYFHEEIAIPFGIDFHIGLPKCHQHRVARVEPVPIESNFFQERIANFRGDLELSRTTFRGPKDWFSQRILNDPDFMELPSASSHGAGTALAMAKFSGILANGGMHEGKTLLSPTSIAMLQEPLSHSVDLTTSADDIYGRGTLLKPVVEGNKHWFMFGHSGYGDQCSSADAHYKVGWAYVTNYLDPKASYATTNKWRPLVETLFRCIHRLEGVTINRRMLNSYEELQNEIKVERSKL